MKTLYPKTSTFLTQNTKYNEDVIGGVKVELKTVEENNQDGFYFEDCLQMFDKFWGDVYFFKKWAYVCNDYQWYRFEWDKYLTANN